MILLMVIACLASKPDVCEVVPSLPAPFPNQRECERAGVMYAPIWESRNPGRIYAGHRCGPPEHSA